MLYSRYFFPESFQLLWCLCSLMFFFPLFTRKLVWVLESSRGTSWEMGQKNSKPSNSKPSYGYGYSYDYGNTSSGYNSRNTGNTSSSYSSRYAPSSENNVQPETTARLQRKYSRIGDDYGSLSQVCLDGNAMASHLLLVLLSTLLLLVCVFH